VVSEHTYKLIEGYFECKALGAAKVKGVTEPIPIYEVLGVGPLRTRLQIAARRGFTRFVGRQRELEQLQGALAFATAGHGQIVGVIGEPGVGKSRLFYEFKLTSQSGCLILEAYSVSYGKASPYLPLIELLKSYFHIQPQDDERARRERVLGKVLGLDRTLEDTLPYLCTLLGIEDAISSLQQMDPQIRRRRTFEALKKLFFRESLNQPLMLIFEDLHWIDTETQGFLDTLSESVASARILLLVNYRPEYRQEWGSKTYYTQLRLAPFGRAEAEEFLDALVGAPAVGVNHDSPLKLLKCLILEKTEGTPFFMEEVVQTLAEEGVLVGDRGQYRVESVPPELHLSPTVQGVLGARIDRLGGEEKALLHHLAVLGREFPLSLVRRVVPHPEEELYRVLAALQRKEFLYEQAVFPEVEYRFKHALTQEVAYGTVLQDRRKALHEKTAQAIESLYAGRLEEHYSELAHHYSCSGNTQKAVEYLHLAGQQAVQRSAYAEAIAHLTTALELLKTLPDTPERTQQELALQIALGVPLRATKGIAALERTYSRVRQLCQQIGEERQIFPALLGLRLFYTVRGEFQTASELCERCLQLAQQVQDPALLLGAHHALGDTIYFTGELIRARTHQEQAIALYDPQQHRFLAFGQGYDLGMDALAHGAWVLWYLGYPEQALQRSKASLTRAQELSHAYSLAHAIFCTAWLHQHRREAATVQERAEAVLTLATEQGFAMELTQATVLRGWALGQQGQGEQGLAQIRQGMTAWHATGAEIVSPYFLALLAETHDTVRQSEEGLAAVMQALTIVERTGERLHEAELYRLKGKLTLQKFQVSGFTFQVPPNLQEEAEACFHKAVEIARQQQAKSWELRAATSFARLWQQQGKQKEAHAMLAEIYNWFTEGFDTKDLQEAKALLEELERSC
jgi:predicted ATPase